VSILLFGELVLDLTASSTPLKIVSIDSSVAFLPFFMPTPLTYLLSTTIELFFAPIAKPLGLA
jgi:hypothetical protein